MSQSPRLLRLLDRDDDPGDQVENHHRDERRNQGEGDKNQPDEGHIDLEIVPQAPADPAQHLPGLRAEKSFFHDLPPNIFYAFTWKLFSSSRGRGDFFRLL